MSGNQAKVAVIGSYAVGMTMGCKRFPGEGETVMGRGFQMLHGGKGSNQAIAVARLGGAVVFGGSVGRDDFGSSALRMLKNEGIDTSFVKRAEGAPTGVGIVIVAESGNNEIVIDLGANNRLMPSDIDAMSEAIAGVDLLLVQLEVNPEAVIRAIDIAHGKGIAVILNPAPFQKLPDEAIRKTTYITPNETEAAAMLGVDPRQEQDGRRLAAMLFERYEVNVLVTLGDKGVYVRTQDLDERVPGYAVNVVDTTGAGDAFSGALAVALGEGRPLRDAVRFANCAAGLSVEVEGVVPSLPTRAVVNARYS
jgi:ribokinase